MQRNAVGGSSLILELWAQRADGGNGPGLNSPLTTQFFDTSPQANHGTLQTFAGTTASGWAGSGTDADPYRLVSDTTSDYVTMASAVSLAAAASSVEMWLRVNTTANNVLGKVGAALFFGPVSTTAFEVQVNDGSGYNDFAVPAMANGDIRHIAFTRSANVNRLYSNGVESSSGSWTNSKAISFDELLRYGSNHSSYPGKCDIIMVRAYSATMTADEVAQNYRIGFAWAPFSTLQGVW